MFLYGTVATMTSSSHPVSMMHGDAATATSGAILLSAAMSVCVGILLNYVFAQRQMWFVVSIAALGALIGNLSPLLSGRAHLVVGGILIGIASCAWVARLVSTRPTRAA